MVLREMLLIVLVATAQEGGIQRTSSEKGTFPERVARPLTKIVWWLIIYLDSKVP
jgi:hypothetical protein